MHTTTTLLAASCLLSLFTPTLAAPSGPGVLGFDFEKRFVPARQVPGHSSLQRRAKTVNAELTNELLLYFINVTIGTPPQGPFSLQLDTGSSDIWLPATDADVCQQEPEACQFGAYDQSLSTSYQDPNYGQFQIRYVDGSQIEGDYVSDVLNIGSTTLTNLTMASATVASRGIGIMGIGYNAGETGVQTWDFEYPNIISVLKNQGFINTLSYSLWLNDLDANTGSILFGGVDTDKYHGDLVSLPVQIDSRTGNLTSFTVAWTGLTITGGGTTSNLSPSNPQPAILDSGTTDLYLPDDIANDIFNGVGVITDEAYGNVVACSLANDDLTFSFTFGGEGGAVVNVSLADFVTPLFTTDGTQPTFRDGTPACAFGIDAAQGNPILFGDAFMRSAYVVYDLENNEIGIAQTSFNSTSSNVKAFESGSGIPGATSTASAASVAQTFSGNPFVTQSAVTATGGGQVGGTSRSPTFRLTSATATAGGSGSASPSSSSAAESSLKAPAAAMMSVVAGLVTVVGFVLGGSLIIW